MGLLPNADSNEMYEAYKNLTNSALTKLFPGKPFRQWPLRELVAKSREASPLLSLDSRTEVVTELKAANTLRKKFIKLYGYSSAESKQRHLYFVGRLKFIERCAQAESREECGEVSGQHPVNTDFEATPVEEAKLGGTSVKETDLEEISVDEADFFELLSIVEARIRRVVDMWEKVRNRTLDLSVASTLSSAVVREIESIVNIAFTLNDSLEGMTSLRMNHKHAYWKKLQRWLNVEARKTLLAPIAANRSTEYLFTSRA
ncbi:hypothetical protein LEL_10522 [Akanthomyces lecanii RCEF 1005]|uniref:Uncharacterized protein n=1 Tax=Akanthomyces lecanii RCEF 1005 TaxID=1081108 RepID=A0A167XK60_CORDF|nr:hypothetical protein LEL_10522 [Akanthomyces lecanii RCEF 1005]